MASSIFLLIRSDGSSPNGSSPDFFSGLRQRSKILRNAPLLARSPRKPSSSFNSILKLSTSTDGRRVAPCRPMPEVVRVSSAMLPLPAGGRRDNGHGTRWFHGGEWRVANSEVNLPDSLLAIRRFAQILAFGRFSCLFALTRGSCPL